MTWTSPIRLAEVPADGLTRDLSPGDEDRAAIAKQLGLVKLDSLRAQVKAKPWFDGVEVSGAWDARIAQTCGVTLERLESELSGDFLIHVVPLGSVHAPVDEDEQEIDPEAMDPPDVAQNGEIDLAAYVVEHLALEIDPFPRKPGVEFVNPDPVVDLSPFAALKALKRDG